MRKKRIAVTVCIAAVFAALVIYMVFALRSESGLHTAVITSDGRTVRTVDLRTAQDETFTVTNGDGYNVICIKDGNIFVSEASCPDKICVEHGELRSEYLPIVCLPNRLVIELK